MLRETSQAPGACCAPRWLTLILRVRFAALQWIGEDNLGEYRSDLAKVLTAGPMSGDLFAAYLAALEKLGESRRPAKEDWRRSNT